MVTIAGYFKILGPKGFINQKALSIFILVMLCYFMFIVANLAQEEVCMEKPEETVAELPPGSSFGEISVLCNIPQPCTVQVLQLCRLLRIDKQSFSSILDIYFYDGRKILNNLLDVIFVELDLNLQFLYTSRLV